jgi:hypothetical protein
MRKYSGHKVVAKTLLASSQAAGVLQSPRLHAEVQLVMAEGCGRGLLPEEKVALETDTAKYHCNNITT